MNKYQLNNTNIIAYNERIRCDYWILMEPWAAANPMWYSI